MTEFSKTLEELLAEGRKVPDVPVRPGPSGLDSLNKLESSAVAEKEGFEPSFPAKSILDKPGLPSEGGMHE